MVRLSKLEKRKKTLEKELSRLESDLRDATRGRRRRDEDDGWRLFGVPRSAGKSTSRKLAVSLQDTGRAKGGRSHALTRDDRFSNYFMNQDFKPRARPPAEEMRLIRNKTIFLLVLAAMILYWLIWRFF